MPVETKAVTFMEDKNFIDGPSFQNQTHMYHRLAKWMQLTTSMAPDNLNRFF